MHFKPIVNCWFQIQLFLQAMAPEKQKKILMEFQRQSAQMNIKVVDRNKILES